MKRCRSGLRGVVRQTGGTLDSRRSRFLLLERESPTSHGAVLPAMTISVRGLGDVKECDEDRDTANPHCRRVAAGSDEASGRRGQCSAYC